ncbi:Na+/H+ antiporter subunit E [Ancylobacter sp. MQZ15Z-1]|uniref:Na+/H+ antiporter subunit E n=1 Tax=Ancylobacter mangrovi TaxID=2972472 RepID=A0A9X2PBB1_9HYPH|nr:Na+/H+ antiporter subunit E [Ancylobacter mangrovi]MCS0495554.1 Na+/H+ antiporter subunit E [Ancylobacter mangrovi]
MPRPSPLSSLRHGALRAAAFLALWLVLHGGGAGAMTVGVLTALAAARLSLALLPSGPGRIAWGRLAGLVARFPGQSLRAGIEVARLALAPASRLRPGLVACPARLPAGTARDVFHAYLSLQPGTLPVGMRDARTVLIHALDLDRPVTREVAAAEAGLARIREPRADG